jgi:hypothetical protein
MTSTACPIGVRGLRFLGPGPLLAHGMRLRPEPAVYVVASGDAISHVGASGRLGDRVRTLAHLGSHKGSARVLCVAHCTGVAPQIWWSYTKSLTKARALETELKADYERQFLGANLECDHGGALRGQLMDALGRESWTAGYVEAIFSIGEHFAYLARPELGPAWATIGIPPGPWAERFRNFTD